jgi:hypothetical protein
MVTSSYLSVCVSNLFKKRNYFKKNATISSGILNGDKILELVS